MSIKRSHKNKNPENNLFTKDNLNNTLDVLIDEDDANGSITHETAEAMRAELAEMRKIVAKEKSKSKGSI